ncbi:MAG: sensor histidine kinase [Cellulosilyticaceae bacterium]
MGHESTKNRWRISIGVFIVGISIIMVLLYPQIARNIRRDNGKEMAEQVYTQQYMIGANYGLYYQLWNEATEEDLSPQDVYLDDGVKFNEYYTLDEFNQDIVREFQMLIQDSNAIDYYASNAVLDKTLTNINQKQLKQLEKNDLLLLEEAYIYYVFMTYDERGELTIKQSSFADISNALMKEEYTKRHMFLENNTAIKPIKNTSYFYGIKSIESFEYVGEWIYTIYTRIVEQYVIGVSFIVLIIFTLIPRRLVQGISSIQKLMKLPFEALMLIVSMIIVCQLTSVEYMIRDYTQGIVIQLPWLRLATPIENTFFIFVINSLVWMLYFSALLVGVVLIKEIIYKGVNHYVKENLILYKGYTMQKAFVKRNVDSISRMNIQEKNIRLMLRAIIINAVILSAFWLLGVWGIIGVVIYSIVLYVLASRVLKNVRSYYEQLLKSTSNLAEGDLDGQVIEEDLGMFEPLKKHIQVIQGDFKKSIEEEVRAQKFKTDLITNVSHDLKTPLTSIISYIDLLKQEHISEEKKRGYIEVLERKAARLQTLIEDLFEMSKVSSGNIILHKDQVDVVALIKQTIFELEDKIEAAGIIFRKQLPEQKVYLSLDSMRTFRVFDNLINNIAKYAMPNSRAYITVKETDTEVYIELKNTAREELSFDTDAITERFVRGDESRNTEGSGLGLAIAKSFVELQGGTLEIKIDGDLFKTIIIFKKDI